MVHTICLDRLFTLTPHSPPPKYGQSERDFLIDQAQNVLADEHSHHIMWINLMQGGWGWGLVYSYCYTPTL